MAVIGCGLSSSMAKACRWTRPFAVHGEGLPMDAAFCHPLAVIFRSVAGHRLDAAFRHPLAVIFRTACRWTRPFIIS